MLTPIWQSVLRRWAFILLGVVGLAVMFQGYTLLNRQQEIQARALHLGEAEAERAARAIDAQLRKLEPVANAIARDLSAGTLTEEGIPARILADLEAASSAFRLGVIYVPYAHDPKVRLFAPYVVRENGQLRSYQMESLIDYTLPDWYKEGMSGEGWGEPHLSKTTHQLVAGYRVHFRKPGSSRKEPDGMVRIDLSMDGIRTLLAGLSLGRTGYGFLTSAQGIYLAHPKDDLVSQQRTVLETAEELDDSARQRVADLALQGRRGHVETVSSLAKLPIMVFIHPVPSSRWALGTALFKSELAPSPTRIRRDIANLGCAIMGLLALGAFLAFGVHRGESGPLWRWKSALAAILALGIGMLWSLTLALPDPPADHALPMVDREGLNKYLQSRRLLNAEFQQVQVSRVPTGLYLQTLKFGGANDVVVTGQAWQRFDLRTQAALPRGFGFPDAEVSDIREAYRRQEGDFEVVEYTFKATLRQKFEHNAKFPFDQAVIRLRIWPKELGTAVVLVPDLEAYQVTNAAALPGIEKDLVVPGWEQKRSYFGFLDKSYSTNFGQRSFVGRDSTPEFCFQFVLARKFLDPFISTMLPVLVVACLLFTLLMAGTKIQEKVTATGFKAMDILRAAATLLFPVVFAQINLRSRLAVSGLLYLEYFYFVMYAVILMVAVNALAFSLGDRGFLHHRDNALPKLLYWPVVLSAFFTISLVFLY